MGEFEMGGGGHAAARQGSPGRPSRPAPDLAGRRGPRSADRQSQLYLEPALLSWLRRPLGKHFSQPAGGPSLGGDALCRVVYRRRAVRPVSEPADGRARMRLWLAAVLETA